MIPARGDTVAVFGARIKQLKADRVELIRQIRTARTDSISTELHHQIEVDALTTQIEWIRGEMPRFYEKPGFTITATALVTIWAVLRMVRISM